MKTQPKNFKRVSQMDDEHITAGQKRSILALVNENKPEYFGRWMNANRIKLMVEPLGENKYKATFKLHHKYGLLGAYDSLYEKIVKLS